MKKRIISAVLAAVVALSAVPASALPPAVAEEKTETAILEEQETGISRKDISVSSINLPKAIEMSQYFWMYCLRIFCMKPLGNIR